MKFFALLAALALLPFSTSAAIPNGTVTIVVTPTVQAAAYSSGNDIGGLLSFANVVTPQSNGGLVQSVSVGFAATTTVPSLDLVLFNANPTNSTITDKSAVAIDATDMAKVIGVVHLSDTSLLGASAPNFEQALNLAMPFRLAAGTTLYGALVARGAVTPASTSDITITTRVLPNQ